MKTNKKELIKILGYIAMIISYGATALADWVKDKEMDDKINECIKEKIATINNEERR